MDDAPARGAAIADGPMADVGHGRGEKRLRPTHDGRVLYVRVTRERANEQTAVVFGDRRQRSDAADVDDVLGASQAEGKQRDEALAAGQHLAVVPELRKLIERLLDRRRPVVDELGGLHSVNAW